MASIYKRKIRAKDGSGPPTKSKIWFIDYTDASTGRRVTGVPGYTDKRATEAKAKELETRSERVAAGLPVEDESRAKEPWPEAVERYQQSLRDAGRSEGHVRAVGNQLTRLGVACKFHRVKDVRPGPLKEWCGKLSGVARTKNLYRDVAVSFCNWLVREGVLAESPLSRVAKFKDSREERAAKTTRRALTAEEFSRLTDPDLVPTVRARAYRVAGLTGLRRSELARLEARDVDLSEPERPRLRLRAEATKNGEAAVLPVPAECASAITEALGKKSGRQKVFKKLPRTRTYHKDLAKCEIERVNGHNERVDFHSLRYFYCASLARSLPLHQVKALMRHKDVRMTANVYLRLNLGGWGEEVWALPPMTNESGARTYKGRSQKSGKLTDSQRREIRERRSKGESLKSLAGAFGVHVSLISVICKGEGK